MVGVLYHSETCAPQDLLLFTLAIGSRLCTLRPYSSILETVFFDAQRTYGRSSDQL